MSAICTIWVDLKKKKIIINQRIKMPKNLIYVDWVLSWKTEKENILSFKFKMRTKIEKNEINKT